MGGQRLQGSAYSGFRSNVRHHRRPSGRIQGAPGLNPYVRLRIALKESWVEPRSSA
jgi:hypothetical protein